MLNPFAASRTRNTLAASRTIKASGGIYVYGWSVTSTSATARTARLEDKDGNIYQDIAIGPGNTTAVFEKSIIPFLADNGLVVNISAVDSDVIFTVFHSNTAGSA